MEQYQECETVYEQQCHVQSERLCQNTTREECHIVQDQVCNTIYNKVCRDEKKTVSITGKLLELRRFGLSIQQPVSRIHMMSAMMLRKLTLSKCPIKSVRMSLLKSVIMLTGRSATWFLTKFARVNPSPSAQRSQSRSVTLSTREFLSE